MMTSSVVGQRRSSKAVPKATLAPKKVMVTVWWSPASLIHYSLLNPGKTITPVRSILNKLMRCTKTCNACSLPLVNRMDPILLHDNTQLRVTQPMLQKLNELGYKVLPHLSYSLDLLPSDCHFFKHPDFFGRENSSTNSRMEEMLFKSSLNPEAQNSFATGIKPSNWQKCVDGNGSYFD